MAKKEKQVEVNFSLTEKQAEAWYFLKDKTTTEVLFGGGAGSGKSKFGAYWLFDNCVNYPGTKWLLGRSKLSDLKKTTLATLLEMLSEFGITDKFYNYNQQENFIRFWNGSEIILKDLFQYPSDNNFDSLGSLEITGAFIDEVNMISEKAKNVVASRIRYKLEQYDLVPKLLLTCNPSKGWVYDSFYKPWKNNSLNSYRRFVQALVKDNPHVSPFYAQQLSRLDELSRRRLLLGEWEYEDSLALIRYDALLSMFEEREVEDQQQNIYFLSVDVARMGKDKSVLIVWNGFNVVEIQSIDKNTIDELLNRVNQLKSKYGIESKNIIIDSDGVGGGLADFVKGCVSFVNNARALNQENFSNMKSQCSYKIAEIINQNKIHFNCLLDIEVKNKIIQELEQIKAHNVDKDGKLQIMPKELIKQQIGRSPDYSDCIMMRAYFELNHSIGITNEYFIRSTSLSRR